MACSRSITSSGSCSGCMVGVALVEIFWRASSRNVYSLLLATFCRLHPSRFKGNQKPHTVFFAPRAVGNLHRLSGSRGSANLPRVLRRWSPPKVLRGLGGRASGLESGNSDLGVGFPVHVGHHQVQTAMPKSRTLNARP